MTPLAEFSARARTMLFLAFSAYRFWATLRRDLQHHVFVFLLVFRAYPCLESMQVLQVVLLQIWATYCGDVTKTCKKRSGYYY